MMYRWLHRITEPAAKKYKRFPVERYYKGRFDRQVFSETEDDEDDVWGYLWTVPIKDYVLQSLSSKKTLPLPFSGSEEC